jgi:hypothetical protein
VRHVAASEPTSIGRRGLKLQLTWQHMDARHATYFNLELVYGVSGLQSVDNNHSTISIMYKRVLCQRCCSEIPIQMSTAFLELRCE